MKPVAPDSSEYDPRMIAAVMAAVELYLEEESWAVSRTEGRISTWRMAARQAGLSMNSHSWTGRDQSQ